MMKHGRELWSLAIVGISMLVMLSGCGNTTTEYAQTSASAPESTYLVEYVPGETAAAVGKTTFQIRVRTRSDGAAATELAASISLMPMMYMTSGMNHSTPMDVVTESSTPGTYDCTAYYLMSSGAGSGYWELQVTIGSETTSFYPAVAGSMGMTPKLKGQSDDLITKTTGTETRTYYLFKDDMTATNSASLFISAQGNNKMTFSSVFSGSTLTNEANIPRTIGTVVVEATTNPADDTSWEAGTHVTGGHWTVPINPSLASMATGTVYVRLFVDGVQKSTDGNIVSSSTSTNGYATISVTEGM